MELFEPILHFFEQRWVHNIIWAVILAIGNAVAAEVVSKTWLLYTSPSPRDS